MRFNPSHIHGPLTAIQLSFLVPSDFKVSLIITNVYATTTVCLFIVTNPGFTLSRTPFRYLSSVELSETKQQSLRRVKTEEKVVASTLAVQ